MWQWGSQFFLEIYNWKNCSIWRLMRNKTANPPLTSWKDGDVIPTRDVTAEVALSSPIVFPFLKKTSLNSSSHIPCPICLTIMFKMYNWEYIWLLLIYMIICTSQDLQNPVDWNSYTFVNGDATSQNEVHPFLLEFYRFQVVIIF